jgi:hypothetical protein
MMRCKHCGYTLPKEELEARFQAGLAYCPNPDCNPIDLELSRKYDRLILQPSEFEECLGETA